MNLDKDKINNIDITINTVEDFVDYQLNNVNEFMFNSIDFEKQEISNIKHQIKYIYSDIDRLEKVNKKLKMYCILSSSILCVITLLTFLNSLFNLF